MIQAAISDVIGPAVAADDPDTLLHQIVGRAQQVGQPGLNGLDLGFITFLQLLQPALEFGHSTSLGLDVIRDRNTLYRETSEGLIENVYILKILNMDDAVHSYTLSVDGIPGIQLRTDAQTIRVEAGDVMDFPVRLQADEGDLEARSSKVVFELVADDDPALAVQEEARFLGPQ